MTVKIKIVGTEQDAKLLKKIISEYMAHASKKEKYECQCFLDLIQHAEKEAKQNTIDEDSND